VYVKQKLTRIRNHSQKVEKRRAKKERTNAANNKPQQQQTQPHDGYDGRHLQQRNNVS
jgi:hypothetical protein